MRTPLALLTLLGLTAILRCGGGGRGPTDNKATLPPGPGVLTHSPIDVAAITDLEPLGWLNPPGHTLPTAHGYFYYAWTWPRPMNPRPWPVLPVVAPGPGTVVWILATPEQPDQKLEIQMTSTFSYYLDHVVLDPGIKVGTQVVGGQRLGQTGPASGAVDLGVINLERVLTGFVNRARYDTARFSNADSPYPFFAEPLRTTLTALVRRNAPDKGGKIDFDLPGRLQGGWFHETVAVADSMGPLGWPKQLAFVPDPNEPSKLRVSLGGYCGLRGLWRPSPGDPDPAQVSVASGLVAYRLLYLDETIATRAGLLLVQLLDDSRIRLQVFPGSTADTGSFTGEALVYVR